MSERAAEPAVRAAYSAAAAGFVAYAVWGSLFPFDFHAVPLSAAGALFWTRWASDAGPWSLTDLLSNVLLFLPIGLLLAAIRGQTRTAGLTPSARTAGLAASTRAPGLTPVAAAAVLSVVIEFAQAFVSWRTPSIVDVGAEIAGAACGVGLWRLVRVELDRLLAAIVGMIRRSTAIEQLLLACCAGFAVAWLLPADFTLRPGEIGDKYAHKRLLLPFVPSPDAATPARLTAVALAAVPLGIAAVICGSRAGSRRSAASGALVAGTGLVVLEALQVPVFSRTTDANELLAAVAGATVAAVAAAIVDRRRITGIDRHTLRLMAIGLLWVCGVLAIDWWPFHMIADRSRLQFEIDAWSRAPFRWPASAADVVPGAALAAIAGAFVAPRLDPRFPRLETTVLTGFAGAVFAVSEAGRVMFDSGRPTLLSVALKLTTFTACLCLGWAATSGHRAAPASRCTG